MSPRYTRLPPNLLKALDGAAEPDIVEPTRAKEYGIVEDTLELPKTGTNGMGVAVWNA